jgi:hypothetical protein
MRLAAVSPCVPFSSRERHTSPVRIPVKWATHSAGKWAGLRKASRRGKDMMTQVAHMGQEKSGNVPHHLVSIISFPSSRFLIGYRRSGPPFR